MNAVCKNSLSRRGYQVKFNLIPRQQERVEKKQKAYKEELRKLKEYRRELMNIELGLQEEITQNTFLESLKCPTNKPKGKLPKSWRVNRE